MKFTPFVAILLLYGLQSYCQSSNSINDISPVYSRSYNEVDRCASQEILLQQLEENPGMQERRKILEEQVQQIVDNPNREIINGIITIPVVFHVIHNGDAIGTGENIHEQYLTAQLDQINEDFRRLNSNADNTWSQADDTEIQFCLVSLDPTGNPTDGILRHNIPGTTWSKSEIRGNILPGIIWDRNYYLNLVCADLSGSLLGFGSFPGGPSDEDAVCCDYKTFGSLALPNPVAGNYKYGRTATHEIGHWLNLRHIWGDDCSASNSCTASDQVNDTPNQDCYTLGFPTTVQNDDCNNTSEGIMYQNFMDYSYDECMNLFTTGQKDRIHASLTTYRPLLATSSCEASPPLADFSPPARELYLCSGQNIQFTDLSTNNPTVWLWTFSGAGVNISNSTGQNPIITINGYGTLTVSLTSSNTAGSDTVIYTYYVYENAPCSAPIANFAPAAGTITMNGSSMQLGFIDSSTNQPSTWEWDIIGAGVNVTNLAIQNPSVTISQEGTLNVELRVSNQAGSDVLNVSYLVQAESPCPDNFAGSNAIDGIADGTGGTYDNGDYETDGEIESTQMIPVGLLIDYDSATGILLDQGFEVQAGAIFDAMIDGCNQGSGGSNLEEDKDPNKVQPNTKE